MAGSDDAEPDHQLPEPAGDQAAVSLAPDPARTGATMRQALHDREQRLPDQERRLLEQGSHAVDWMRATAAGSPYLAIYLPQSP